MIRLSIYNIKLALRPGGLVAGPAGRSRPLPGSGPDAGRGQEAAVPVSVRSLCRGRGGVRAPAQRGTGGVLPAVAPREGSGLPRRDPAE